MNKIAELILKLIYLIEQYFSKLAKDKYENDKKEIAKDPVDFFNGRYGNGVQPDAAQRMPSNKTDKFNDKMEQGENGNYNEQGGFQNIPKLRQRFRNVPKDQLEEVAPMKEEDKKESSKVPILASGTGAMASFAAIITAFVLPLIGIDVSPEVKEHVTNGVVAFITLATSVLAIYGSKKTK